MAIKPLTLYSIWLMVKITLGLGAIAVIGEVIGLMRETREVVGQIPQEIAETRAMIDRRVDAIAVSLDGRLGSIEQSARAEVRATRTELLALVDRRIGETSVAAVDEIRQTRAEVVRRLDPPLAALTSTLDEYRAVPARVGHATSQIWDCEGNPDCLENRYVSVSRAIETASRAIATGAPRIASAGDRLAESSIRSADNTERLTVNADRFMVNLERASRPLPAWVRIPLSIAVPSAQIALPFVLR